MADNEIKKGLLYDDKGNFSSGRVVKLTSLLMAVILGVVGLVGVFFKPASASGLTDYCFKMVGLFAATATGAEITQKVTGR